MPAPAPKTPTPSAADLARAIRRAALPKAAQTVVELLDHTSGSIRLEAARTLFDREEGRPTQTVRVEQSDHEREQRAALGAFVEHVRGSTPELLGAALTWLQTLAEGTPAPVPAGLLTPPSGPALDLYERAMAASVVVEVLPS